MAETKPENDTINFRPKMVFGMAPPDRRRLRRANVNGHAPQGGLFSKGSTKRLKRLAPALPAEDNTPEGLRAFLAANAHYRETAWPEPYRRTNHRIHLGDARDLSWI